MKQYLPISGGEESIWRVENWGGGLREEWQPSGSEDNGQCPGGRDACVGDIRCGSGGGGLACDAWAGFHVSAATGSTNTGCRRLDAVESMPDESRRRSRRALWWSAGGGWWLGGRGCLEHPGCSQPEPEHMRRGSGLQAEAAKISRVPPPLFDFLFGEERGGV